MGLIIRASKGAVKSTKVQRSVGAVAKRVLLPEQVRFLLFPPTIPSGVEKVKKVSTLGGNYDTEWARTPAALAVRGFLMETVTRGLINAVAPPEVEGVDRIANLDAPAIFACNHASHLDTSIILTHLPLKFRRRAVVAAGADYFFDKRWKAAWWSLSIGAIPVERTKVTRKSAELATELLKDDFSLVIFPEGGRTPDGWMRPFRGGAAFLSIRSDRPVVPMYLGGSRRILGKGSKRLTPSKTVLTFGSPMWPLPDEDAREFNLRIETAVHQLADEQSTDWWSARKRAAQNTTPTKQGPTGTSQWRRAWALSKKREYNSPTWPKR